MDQCGPERLEPPAYTGGEEVFLGVKQSPDDAYFGTREMSLLATYLCVN